MYDPVIRHGRYTVVQRSEASCENSLAINMPFMRYTIVDRRAVSYVVLEMGWMRDGRDAIASEDAVRLRRNVSLVAMARPEFFRRVSAFVTFCSSRVLYRYEYTNNVNVGWLVRGRCFLLPASCCCCY